MGSTLCPWDAGANIIPKNLFHTIRKIFVTAKTQGNKDNKDAWRMYALTHLYEECRSRSLREKSHDVGNNGTRIQLFFFWRIWTYICPHRINIMHIRNIWKKIYRYSRIYSSIPYYHFYFILHKNPTYTLYSISVICFMFYVHLHKFNGTTICTYI